MISLESKIAPIIEEVTTGIYERYPELLDKYGEAGKQKCREDNQHHFDHLETAYQVDDSVIFTDYAIWLNDLLTARGMDTAHLIDNFVRIEQALRDNLDAGRKKFYTETLKQAVNVLENRSNASERGG